MEDDSGIEYVEGEDSDMEDMLFEKEMEDEIPRNTSIEYNNFIYLCFRF